MSYRDKILQKELESKEFKSFDEPVAKSRLMWLVWKSAKWLDSSIYAMLLDVVEVSSTELLMILYSAGEDTFLVAYAPPRYANAIKQLEQGTYIAIRISPEGTISMEYAEGDLEHEVIQEAMQDFMQELEKAYASRPQTWQKVYTAMQKHRKLWEADDELRF